MGHALLVLMLGTSWVNSPNFPQESQEKAYAATYRLKVNGSDGSAVCIGRMGKEGPFCYLTAAHVVGKAKTVALEQFDPKTNKAGEPFEVKVTDVWENEDLALLRGGGAEVPYVRLCPAKKTPAVM